MDKKCKNCGQFLDDKDLFCRYCGCPNPIAEVKKVPKLTKRQAEDMLQESKTIVACEDMDSAIELDYSLIKVKRKGELFSLRLRSVFVAIIAFICSGAGLAMAFLLKGVDGNQWLLFTGIFGGILIIFLGLAVAVERLNLISIYGSLKEQVITVPKYGLRKTPMFLLGGFVFTMDTDCECPTCKLERGEKDVKGDLHVELILGRAVAVCNFNRKHIFNISSESFFDYYLGRTAKDVKAFADAQSSAQEDMPQTDEVNCVNNEDSHNG